MRAVMHADAFPRPAPAQDEGLGRAIAWAVAVHVLVVAILLLSPLLSWDPDRISVAGAPYCIRFEVVAASSQPRLRPESCTPRPKVRSVATASQRASKAPPRSATTQSRASKYDPRASSTNRYTLLIANQSAAGGRIGMS